MNLKRISERRYEMQNTSYGTKDIPKSAGFWWDPDHKVWWTNNMEKAYILREYASDELQAWLEQEYNALKSDMVASSATDADIDIPAPEGLEYMPFQKAGISFVREKFLEHQSGVMIADEMGLGKTIQALGLINDQKYSKVLIVCPASLKLNWKREAEKWLPGDLSVGIVNSKKIPDDDILIINYDILNKNVSNLIQVPWDFIVLDEAHYAKNPKAMRTRAVRKMTDKFNSLLLTGTPILNRPKEAYEMLVTMDPEEWQPRFTKFMFRYTNAEKSKWGWSFEGGKNLDELQKILRRYMVRRMKADVLKDLPPKTRQTIIIDSSSNAELKKVSKKMDEFETEWKKSNPEEYEKSIEELSWPQAKFSEMSQLRHEVGIAKVPEVIKFVDNILDTNGKVVVFAHHRDVIATMMDHWGEQAVQIVGGMSGEAKEESVTRFQTDPSVRIFVGNIEAAGVGLTLTAASTVVFAELAWRPADIQQAEDRLHRIGQHDNVLVYHIVVDDTLDAKIANTIIEKQKIIDASTNVEIVNGSSAIVNKLTEEEATRTEAVKEAQESVLTAVPDNSRKIQKVIEVAKEKGVKVEYSEERERAIVLALRGIASCDGDRAKVINNVGFNKTDTSFGCSLAMQDTLSGTQFVCAYRMLQKYQRQIPTEIYESIY